MPIFQNYALMQADALFMWIQCPEMVIKRAMTRRRVIEEHVQDVKNHISSFAQTQNVL
jgi:hypothetical protein